MRGCIYDALVKTILLYGCETCHGLYAMKAFDCLKSLTTSACSVYADDGYVIASACFLCVSFNVQSRPQTGSRGTHGTCYRLSRIVDLVGTSRRTAERVVGKLRGKPCASWRTPNLRSASLEQEVANYQCRNSPESLKLLCHRDWCPVRTGGRA